MIRVVVCEPEKPAEVREIGETLGDWQKLVGGYVEERHLSEQLYFYCNEDGIEQRLPFNRVVVGHFVLGTFFVARGNAEEIVSLDDADVERVLRMLEG